MAVRQYVGARYVPKFYEFNNGVWQNNTEYEPLTIVQYNGNSYTSKKSVPSNIGNPSSNPEYWASTGNYNAQVEAYRQKVEEEIARTNNLYSRNIKIITDSYGTTNGDGSTIITPYTQYLQNYLGLNSDTYEYKAQNGAGFGNGQFLSQLNTMEDDDSVTELYVFGGWNDISSRHIRADVWSGMDSFSAAAHAKFPNAKIYLGLLAYAYDITAASMDLLDELLTTTYAQCTRHGFNGFLDTFGICATNVADMWANISTDQGKAHPSTTGSLFIAMRLAPIILKHSPAYRYTYPLTLVPETGITIVGSPTIKQHSVNGQVSMEYLNSISIEGNFTLPTLFGSSDLVICSVNSCINNSAKSAKAVTVPIRYKTDGNYIDAIGVLKYYNKQLSIRIAGVTVSGVTALSIGASGYNFNWFPLD